MVVAINNSSFFLFYFLNINNMNNITVSNQVVTVGLGSVVHSVLWDCC